MTIKLIRNISLCVERRASGQSDIEEFCSENIDDAVRPITTGYVDKICKNKDYVPEGKIDDRLFFL